MEKRPEWAHRTVFPEARTAISLPPEPAVTGAMAMKVHQVMGCVTASEEMDDK